MIKTIKIHDFDDDKQLVRDMKISRRVARNKLAMMIMMAHVIIQMV